MDKIALLVSQTTFGVGLLGLTLIQPFGLLRAVIVTQHGTISMC